MKPIYTKEVLESAVSFGVSDKAIERRCKKLGITKPSPGYWRKLETNTLT